MIQSSSSRKVRAGLILLSLLSPAILAQTPTAVPVLTWRYDLTHAGENTNETALNPTNVNAASFGKLFSLSVDSTVYAQPLYVPGLKMSDGQLHNVLFVATENDSIYAFDADSNNGSNAHPLWQISLLTAAHGAAAGATAIPWQDTGSPDVAPTIGITGTPAINTATNTMYVVANTKENGAYFSRLHAINILTGAEQAGSPVDITATVAGTGAGSSGGQISFSPFWQNQRTALDYYNGYVYFGYAAHGDLNNWHGWLFAYDASTLKQTAALCLTPDDIGGGVWGSGAGLPIDTSISGGRMFVVTGNGGRSNPPFNASTDYGQSVIAFNLANGKLTPTDEFTAFNYSTLNSHDWDQGSGGLLMLPNQQGAYPHLLITAGKEGRITVLNRDNLGGYASGASSNTNAVQDISGVITAGQGFWGTAAYWNDNIYVWAGGELPSDNGIPNRGMLFKMNSGVLGTTPASETSFTSAYPGPTFSISSNGTQDGIAWAIKSDQFNTNGPAVLYAFDANDLGKILYESDTNASRDSAGPANKFSVPVVTNGKVYVATHGQVDVYGLLNAQTTAAAPAISPNGGTFYAAQTVKMSTSTSTAAIYYTVDGSTPTTASTEYSGPITVSSNTTLKAIASAPGYLQSSVTTASFSFPSQTPAPAIQPPGGTYLAAQTVTLSDADGNAAMYYTTDGSTPSASSTRYAGAIQVAASETLKAIAIDPALTSSNIVTASYTIQAGATSFNFADFSSTAGLTLNGTAAAESDHRLYLTTNATWQAGSAFWNAPVNIQQFSTQFDFQIVNGKANGFTFTIQNVGPTALGGDSAGLAYQNIQKSVAVKFNFYNYQSEGADSTGVYTNGQPPVNPTVDISPSGIQLASGDTIRANIGYDGTTLTLSLIDLTTNKTFNLSEAINIPSIVGGNTAYVGFTGGTGGLASDMEIVNWTYAVSAPQGGVAAPVFSLPAGTYTSAQNVTLSDSTSGATIYYTTDGSTPTTSSTVYSSPIAVASSMTIKAIAATSSATSSVASAAYVLQQNTASAIDFSSGFASTAGLQLNGSAVAGNNQLALTTGGTWQAGSVFWTTPVNVQAFTTTFQFQLLNAQANGFTFTLQNVGPTALGSDSASLGYHGIGQSVAVKFNFYNYQGEGSDSTGVYTDGAHPYPTPSIDISPSGIQLASGDKMQAQISYDGATLTLTLTDLVTNKTFTTSQAINIPQVVGGSTAYAGFTAGTGGLSANQNLISWTYSTQATAPQTAAPTFTPPAGTYTSAQNVTLSDSTSGATIYYTTDGSTPTTSSTVYSSPIAVASSMTIKAIAATSSATSSVASSAYTIGASSSSFSLSGNSFVIGWRGGVIHVPVTVTPSGGFTGTVSLSCSVAGPSGAVSLPTCTVSAQPPAITGSGAVKGTIYIQTVRTTTLGNYTVTVHGSSGTLSNSTAIPFTVN